MIQLIDFSPWTDYRLQALEDDFSIWLSFIYSSDLTSSQL